MVERMAANKPLSEQMAVYFTGIYASFGLDELTLKHRETHGCIVSTAATDALVLKHPG